MSTNFHGDRLSSFRGKAEQTNLHSLYNISKYSTMYVFTMFSPHRTNSA